MLKDFFDEFMPQRGMSGSVCRIVGPRLFFSHDTNMQFPLTNVLNILSKRNYYIAEEALMLSIRDKNDVGRGDYYIDILFNCSGVFSSTYAYFAALSYEISGEHDLLESIKGHFSADPYSSELVVTSRGESGGTLSLKFMIDHSNKQTHDLNYFSSALSPTVPTIPYILNLLGSSGYNVCKPTRHGYLLVKKSCITDE